MLTPDRKRNILLNQYLGNVNMQIYIHIHGPTIFGIHKHSPIIPYNKNNCMLTAFFITV